MLFILVPKNKGKLQLNKGLTTQSQSHCQDIGVQHLVARGYFIIGGKPEGALGQAPALRIACCQTGTQVSHL